MGKQTVGKSSCEGSNSSSRGPYGYSQSSYFGDYFSFCSETLAAECKTLGQVNVALKRAGLESPNLLLGIDFTQSNEWTGRMANEEYKVNGSSSQNEGCPNSSAERATSRKNKKKKQSQESVKTEHEQEIHEHSPPAGGNLQAGDMRVESGKNKIKKKLLEEASLSKEGSKKCNGERKKKVKETKRQLLQKTAEDEEEDVNTVGFSQEVNPAAEGGKIETAKGKEEEEVIGINPIEEEDPKSNVEMVNRLKKKKNKEQLLKEAAKADKRGVCYLSRIPPHMDHVKLRHILSQYGEIQRIYLAPEDPTARVNRKRAGGFRGQEFSEGWVEFTNKSIAKRVANMLNGEQIGGRKRSQFYYDLWNIKYLSKFKWDDLTEEIAYKSVIREQKLALEISAAKRERDFYLNKVDQSRALSSIEERLKKKQKVQQESGGQLSVGEQAPKVIRQFPQTKPVANKVEESKSQLSKDILAGVFGVL